MDELLDQERESLREDLALAQSVQLLSLPKPETFLAGRRPFGLAAMMRPVRDVGGDFYDFYLLDQNRLALVIADVSGKSIPAALFMMRAKSVIRDELSVFGCDLDLSLAAAAINDRLCEGNRAKMFVTAWIGVVDLQTGDFKYVNAGHNPPILRRADGSLEWLRSRSGLVFGMRSGKCYCPWSGHLDACDSLVLYTDGVTEAQNEAGEMYGEARLLSALSCQAAGTPEKIAQELRIRVNRSVTAFSDDADPFDDVTFLSFTFGRA